jgi:3-hydroxyisobutyrate dehydrogenase
MAKNLRAKIPASDTLIIRDVNEEAAKRFVAEAQEAARSNGAGADEGRVEIAENAREVAEKSVSSLTVPDGTAIFKKLVERARP